MSKGAQDHDAMLREMRAPWLWTNATVVLLGLWLISSPWTFAYRSAAMTWSDVTSGLLMAAFAGIAFVPRYDFYGRWGVALIGTWLQFAPLVFGAPDGVAYVTDTLVGALAITLSILVPMMPGMAHHMAMMRPWPDLAASVALGVWLMFAPAMFGSTSTFADSDHLTGALIVTVAAISTAEVIRALRFLNLLFAVWLLIAPWTTSGATMAARWNDMAVGLAVGALALPRGRVRERYADWDRFVI